ncbi:MAG TPA: DUF3189 family protein [Firmicutes bacterium]|nr:DUF3189 family protein [Bacillota bacterium]
MKIIYHCYGGAHSSVVAAAVHLGELPQDKKPQGGDILKCAYFDEVPSVKIGIIHYLGKDNEGNEIYNMGVGNAGKIIEKVLPEILNIYGIDPGELYMINTLVCVNWMMRLGGFISRSLKLTRIGRPLVIRGTIAAFPAIVKLVEKSKKEIKARRKAGSY